MVLDLYLLNPSQDLKFGRGGTILLAASVNLAAGCIAALVFWLVAVLLRTWLAIFDRQAWIVAAVVLSVLVIIGLHSSVVEYLVDGLTPLFRDWFPPAFFALLIFDTVASFVVLATVWWLVRLQLRPRAETDP